MSALHMEGLPNGSMSQENPTKTLLHHHLHRPLQSVPALHLHRPLLHLQSHRPGSLLPYSASHLHLSHSPLLCPPPLLLSLFPPRSCPALLPGVFQFLG